MPVRRYDSFLSLSPFEVIIDGFLQGLGGKG